MILDTTGPTSDQPVTITMPLSAWKLVAESLPSEKMTYTPEGEALFNAWQPIMQNTLGASQSK
jgi:hypothetical protein